MVKKIYRWYSWLLWALWTVGLGATAFSYFRFDHEHQWLFWDFVLPYNNVVHTISMIPLVPILFLVNFFGDKIERRSSRKTVILFLSTTLAWLVYVFLYIYWTES